MHHQLTLADGTGNLPLLVDLVTRTWSEKPLIYVVHAYESDGVYLEPFPVSFSGNVALRVATREELVAANWEKVQEATITTHFHDVVFEAPISSSDLCRQAQCVIHGADYTIWLLVSEDLKRLEQIQKSFPDSKLGPSAFLNDSTGTTSV